MRPSPKVVAFAMPALFLAFAVPGTLFDQSNSAQDQSLLESIALLAGFCGFQVIGSLLMAKRPEHLVGHLFSAIGLLVSFGFFAGGYATYALFTHPGSLPFAKVLGWFATWTWYPTIALCMILLPLYFPDGRLPGRRWRWLTILAVVATAVVSASYAFAGNLDLDTPDGAAAVANPLSVGLPASILSLATSLGFAVFIFCLFATAASFVMRFHRSRGETRQQLKWFSSGVFCLVMSLVLQPILPAGGGFAFDIGVVLIPTSVAVAIFRYHLYEIDRLINRTLVYGLLSAILGALYAALVVGLQGVLRPFSGGSDLAIVVTTLVVAAVALPARRRLQETVDRRFNRRQYNATRTVEAFGSRLRESIDLDTLRYELLAVVDETMQPANASIWLPSGRASQ